MIANIINLDRRFVEWHANKESDFELLYAMQPSGYMMDWTALLERSRVVLLAEAGSGKTTELNMQASRLKQAGNHCFVLTLQNIGAHGFHKALRAEDRSRFREWQHSGEKAWLFLDSFDEAKQSGHCMMEVLNEVASVIEGLEGRVHIVLCGRFADWELRNDLQTLLDRIPVPVRDAPLSDVPPNEALFATLNDENPLTPQEAEQPLVVVMGPLDEERIKKFATSRGVKEAGEFLQELDDRGLSRLARRPIDLDWLVEYWRREGRLGSWEVMLRESLRERLKEPDQARTRNDSLGPESAMRGLELVGSALVLGRCGAIRLPGTGPNFGQAPRTVDLARVLCDWRPKQLQSVLTRAVFEAAASGYAKLCNDNEGEVRGYLTASWLHRLRKRRNCPWTRLKSLVFADTYGERVIRPSLRSTAAWLSLWDREVCAEVLRRDALSLMCLGDPGSLPLETRTRVLEIVVQEILSGAAVGSPGRHPIKLMCRPDMAPAVRLRWVANERDSANPRVRELLLSMMWWGRLDACRDLVLGAACTFYNDRYSALFAGRALAAVGSKAEKRRYADHVLENLGKLNPEVICLALDELFPSTFTVTEFIRCLKHLFECSDEESTGHGLDHYGPKLAARINSRIDALQVLRALLEVCRPLTLGNEEPVEEVTRVCGTLEAAAIRLLELTTGEEAPSEGVEAALIVEAHDRLQVRTPDSATSKILREFRRTRKRRLAAMWHALDYLRRTHPIGEGIRGPTQLRNLAFDPCLATEDLPSLINEVASKVDPFDTRFGIHAAMELWDKSGRDQEILEEIRTVAISPEGDKAIDSWLTPLEKSAPEKKLEGRIADLRQERAEQTARENRSWIDFKERLRADPDQLREIPPPAEEGVDGRIYQLWWFLDRLGQNQSRRAIRDLSPLIPIFGEDVVDALQDALISHWRHWRPKRIPKPSSGDRIIEHTNDVIGLVGVTQEAANNTRWASQLSSEEVTLAATYATVEINEFPFWLEDLARVHPILVGNVIWSHIQSDLQAGEQEVPTAALQQFETAGPLIIDTIAESLMAWLEVNPSPPSWLLERVLGIFRHATDARSRVAKMCQERFLCERDPHARAAFSPWPSWRMPTKPCFSWRREWASLMSRTRPSWCRPVWPR